MLRHRERPGSGHRVLEGFLRRVAADPEAGAFALRGGMLVRHWFPDVGRVAHDVDLVCAWSLDLPAVRRSLSGMLARDVGDGVRFGDRFRTDVIQTHTPHPGVRLVAPALVHGQWAELHADLTFRLPVWPEATMADLPGAVLPVCRPETIVARKLAVSAERGPGAWRPKDLADLWLVTKHRPLRDLGEAVERTMGPARLVDGPADPRFWRDPGSAMRWSRFLHRHPDLAVPRDPARVAGEVIAALAPLVPGDPACR